MRKVALALTILLASNASAARIDAKMPRSIDVPAGTHLSVRLSQGVGSDTSHVEDRVRGTLTQPLVVRGITAVPAGAEVMGTVTSVHESGRVKGKAHIAFMFTRLIVGGASHPIHTAPVSRLAKSSTRNDVEKGAIGAGAGALVGAIAGGKKGAAIGAGAGGAGAVLVTKGKEVRLGPGTVVSTALRQSVTIER